MYSYTLEHAKIRDLSEVNASWPFSHQFILSILVNGIERWKPLWTMMRKHFTMGQWVTTRFFSHQMRLP